MRYIIVPTDFSKASQNALEYALMLSTYYDYGIKLIHVYSPTPSLDYELSSSPILQIEKQQRDRLEKIAVSVTNYRSDDTVLTLPDVSWELVYGFAGDEIIHLTKADDCAFVVMGSTGETGVLSKLFGKVSTYVATHAHCPVFLIPQDYMSAKPLKHLCYCSDDLRTDSTAILEVLNVTNKLDATLHLLHVNKPGEYYIFEPVLKLLEERDENLKYIAESIEGEHVEEAIMTYVNNQDLDLIIVTRKHRSAIAQLFHRSISKKIAFFANKPILILHESDNHKGDLSN